MQVRKDTPSAEVKANYYRVRCVHLVTERVVLHFAGWGVGVGRARPPPGRVLCACWQQGGGGGGSEQVAQHRPPTPHPTHSRLVHPDKCTHPRASEAAAVVNQVRPRLPAAADAAAPACLPLLPAAPGCGGRGARPGERARVLALFTPHATPTPRAPQAYDTLSNSIKKLAYDAYVE